MPHREGHAISNDVWYMELRLSLKFRVGLEMVEKQMRIIHQLTPVTTLGLQLHTIVQKYA